MIATREQLLERVREDGAEDWAQVVQALEDGAYLGTLGVAHTVVEHAHEHASCMAQTHPDYRFYGE